jgi:hypothetical protein
LCHWPGRFHEADRCSISSPTNTPRGRSRGARHDAFAKAARAGLLRGATFAKGLWYVGVRARHRHGNGIRPSQPRGRTPASRPSLIPMRRGRNRIACDAIAFGSDSARNQLADLAEIPFAWILQQQPAERDN